jgi:hypothetical protein
LKKEFLLLRQLSGPICLLGYLKNIKLLDSGMANKSPFKNMGAQNFFGKLPDEVVNYYRNVKHYSYGFPSGHTSGAVALWGSVSVSFKIKWLYIIGTTFIFFVAFARLYLGKHFFIDILGGFVLGILVIGLNYYIFSNTAPPKIEFDNKRYFKTFFYIVYMIAIPLFVLWLTKSKFAAQILGLNSAFILIKINQTPLDSGSILKRILRVSIAIFIFIAINYFISNIYEFAFAKETRILRLFKEAITYFFMIWGSTKILFLMGLYKKSHLRN